MTASHLAVWQKRDTVSAQELYCGADCTLVFTQRKFKPILNRPLLPPITSVPWRTADKAKRRITLQNGEELDVATDTYGDFVVHLSGRNAVDAIWRDWFRTDGVFKRGLTVMNAKHVGRLSKQLVTECVSKRKTLQRVLHPSGMEVLSVLVSLAAREKGLDDVSAWLESQCKDDWTCVISASEGRLAWSLSPVLAYMLSHSANCGHDVSYSDLKSF